jgi:uroporphyrinogen-III synthase
MKILFTKTGIEHEVSEKLETGFSCDFKDFIAIEKIKTKPFPLKNSSLIFTSVNAVKAFFDNGFKPNEIFQEAHYNKIYAVGLKTKKELRNKGFGTFKVKKHLNDLSEFILKHSQKENFIHFCGNLALDILDKALPLQNISYKKVVLYNNLDADSEVDFLYFIMFSLSKINFGTAETHFHIYGETHENETFISELKKFVKNIKLKDAGCWMLDVK